MTDQAARECWRGDSERKARIVRLIVHGKGKQAQMLLEAEAASEAGSSYTREPQRTASQES